MDTLDFLGLIKMLPNYLLLNKTAVLDQNVNVPQQEKIRQVIKYKLFSKSFSKYYFIINANKVLFIYNNIYNLPLW